MNLVGRIFVVLILLMSLTFMGFALAVYATHQSWERVVNRAPGELKGGEPLGLKYQLEDATAKRRQLEAHVEELKNQVASEQADKTKRLGQLQTEATELRKEHDALVNEHAKSVQQAREAAAAMESTQQTLAAMRKEIATLRDDIHTAQVDRDEQFKKFAELTDRFNQAQSELDRLKSQNVTIAEQIARYRQVGMRLGVNLDVPPEGVTPKLDGVVLAASKEGMVEISLGADDGLARGALLDVYRGARYLGRIEVMQTSPEKSVAKILREYRKGPIEKEDRVATRIN